MLLGVDRRLYDAEHRLAQIADEERAAPEPPLAVPIVLSAGGFFGGSRGASLVACIGRRLR